MDKKLLDILNSTCMEEIIDTLNEASDAYYNSGKPIMSDADYDKLYAKLQELEEETGIIMSNSLTQNVGTQILDALEKVTIDPPMLSLAKCHSVKEISAFNSDNKNLIAMIKCDGLSVRIVYEDGKLISANTRGDGVVGANVTEHVKQFINVPLTIKKEGRYVIDGEAIIREKDFDKSAFANQRNAASGALNLLDTSEVKKRKLSFIAWDVIEGANTNSLADNLMEANTLGFDIVDYVTDLDWTDEYLNTINEIIVECAQQNGIPCDGVVWKFDDIEFGKSLGKTEHHYKNGIAWKPAQVTVESTLTGIEWSGGRTGQITPVGLFNEVDILGSTVARASLHNLSVMKEVLNKPYIGQKITVTKSNMIIPQILSGEDTDKTVEYIEIPTICPYCGQPLVQRTENESTFLYCENELCSCRVINSIDHFAGKSGLDIKGLSVATLEFLADMNWVNSILDLYSLREHELQWSVQDGWGEASVKKILDSIDAHSKDVEPWRFISALGIPLVGKRMAKQLMVSFKSVNDFITAAEGDFKFENLNGVGPEIANGIHTFNYTQAKELLNYISFKEEEIKNEGTTCAGLTFVITGSLEHFSNRNELVAKIEGLGGKVAGSVSGSTNYLIINDSNSTTSKAVKARSLGIPCITEQEFIDKFL